MRPIEPSDGITWAENNSWDYWIVEPGELKKLSLRHWHKVRGSNIAFGPAKMCVFSSADVEDQVWTQGEYKAHADDTFMVPKAILEEYVAKMMLREQLLEEG